VFSYQTHSISQFGSQALVVMYSDIGIVATIYSISLHHK